MIIWQILKSKYQLVWDKIAIKYCKKIKRQKKKCETSQFSNQWDIFYILALACTNANTHTFRWFLYGSMSTKIIWFFFLLFYYFWCFRCATFHGVYFFILQYCKITCKHTHCAPLSILYLSLSLVILFFFL